MRMVHPRRVSPLSSSLLFLCVALRKTRQPIEMGLASQIDDQPIYRICSLPRILFDS